MNYDDDDDDDDDDYVVRARLLFPLISPATAPINKLPIKTISSTADIDYQKYKYMTNQLKYTFGVKY